MPSLAVRRATLSPLSLPWGYYRGSGNVRGKEERASVALLVGDHQYGIHQGRRWGSHDRVTTLDPSFQRQRDITGSKPTVAIWCSVIRCLHRLSGFEPWIWKSGAKAIRIHHDDSSCGPGTDLSIPVWYEVDCTLMRDTRWMMRWNTSLRVQSPLLCLCAGTIIKAIVTHHHQTNGKIPVSYNHTDQVLEHPGLHLSLLTIFNCRVRRTGGPVASDRPSLQHECGIPSLHDTCPVVI